MSFESMSSNELPIRARGMSAMNNSINQLNASNDRIGFGTNSDQNTTFSANSSQQIVIYYPINKNKLNPIIVYQSPQQSIGPSVTQNQPIVQIVNFNPQLISANTSPNPTVMTTVSDVHQNMDQICYKCRHCGQGSTSPINRCSHCSQNQTNRLTTKLPAIPTNKYYTTASNSGLGRGNRARMQIYKSAVYSSMNSSNVRSLNNINNFKSNPNRLNTNLNPIIHFNQLSSQSVGEMANNGIDIEVGAQVDQTFEFPIISYPNYVMFGTYRAEVKSIEFKANAIKLTNVAPNSLEKKAFKYHIIIPFVEMNQLLYCTDSSLPVLFVKPTKESNDKIQECMDLGPNSPNGLRFDTNSDDPRERYIVIHLKEKFGEKFVRALNRCSKQENKGLECSPINVDKATLLVLRAQTRSTNISSSQLNYQRVIYSSSKPFKSPVVCTPPKTNPFIVSSRASYRGLDSESTSSSSSPTKPMSCVNRRSLTKNLVQNVIQTDVDIKEEIIEVKIEPNNPFKY